jgi:16S rRNA (cytosine967-C5)-methyltransferase
MDHFSIHSRTFLGLLDSLEMHWHSDPSLPARIDRLIKSDKRLGSRDRKLYRELIYTTLRFLPWVGPLLNSKRDLAVQVIAWLAVESPATHHFKKDATLGWPACNEDFYSKEKIICSKLQVDQLPSLLPLWIKEESPEALEMKLYTSLNQRAPLWLRLQTDNTSLVFNEFKALGWTWKLSELLPGAIKMETFSDVSKSQAYLNGLVEIQDIGSQLILESIGISESEHWLDACAGAGGKTLQLARILGPEGKVDCFDIRTVALDALKERAKRAGLTHQINTLSRLEGTYDGVLVDAPCSGSGTWRRSPHLKWVTYPSTIADYAQKQAHILEEASHHVKHGGRLVYATCSICKRENESVVETFLLKNLNFALSPFKTNHAGVARKTGLIFWPHFHDGDGYFVASLIKD